MLSNTSTWTNDTNSTAQITETLSPEVYTALGLYLSIAMIVGTLANGSALFVFIFTKQLRSPTNVFIIGLLSSDLLMCTVGIPLAATSNFAGKWLWGWNGCVFHAFTVYFLGLSNLYILCAISVDRYIIIAKPLQASKINYRVVNISIFLCYFFGFFWSAVPFVGWSSFAYEGGGTACGVSYDYNDASAFSYNVTILFTCFIIPIIVMLYSYYYVYMTIRSMARNTAFDKKSRIAKRNLRIEKKMAKTIAMMIGIYLFAWTPYAVTAFWVAFGFGTLPVIVGTIPAMFAKSASVWNPLIYVFTNKQFRMALYFKLPCSGLRTKLIKKEEEKDDDSDQDDERSQSQSVSKSTKVQVKPSKKPGVAPIVEDSDVGEITVIEDLGNIEESKTCDETEMKDLSKSQPSTSTT